MNGTIIADRRQKMAAYDALRQPLRDVIDYGPMNPDSVFPAEQLQRSIGPKRAAEIIARQIGENFPGWAPERRSPLAAIWPALEGDKHQPLPARSR